MEQAVRHARSHHARRGFRAQGQAFAIAISERIHLLLDDIRHFANRAFEQLSMLKQRQTNLGIAI